MNQVLKPYSSPSTATTRPSMFKEDVKFYHAAFNKKMPTHQPQLSMQTSYSEQVESRQQQHSMLNSRFGSFLLSVKKRDGLLMRLATTSTTKQVNTSNVAKQDTQVTKATKKSLLKRIKLYHSKRSTKQQQQQQQSDQPYQTVCQASQPPVKLKLNLSRESLNDINLSIINEDLIDLDANDEHDVLRNARNSQKSNWKVGCDSATALTATRTTTINQDMIQRLDNRNLNDSHLHNDDTLSSSSLSTSTNNMNDTKIMDICCCDLMISSMESKTTANDDDCYCTNHDSDSAICHGSAEKLSMHYDDTKKHAQRTQTPTGDSMDSAACSLQASASNLLTKQLGLIDTLTINQIVKLRSLYYIKLNELFLKHLKYTIKLSDHYQQASTRATTGAHQSPLPRFYSFRSSFNSHASFKDKRLKQTSPADAMHIFGTGLNLSSYKAGNGFLPLPMLILKSMKIIERNCVDLVGIFRKPGVKTRIDEMHKFFDTVANLNLTRESLTNTNDNFILDLLYDEPLLSSNEHKENENSSVNTYKFDCAKINQVDFFDLADLIKQFFRELPECLLTNKFSEVLISIFSPQFPEAERFHAIQYTIMLLPDENREALYLLLLFLHNIQLNKENNSMNATNLATCFVPSLFNLNIMKMAVSTNNKENTILSSMFSPKRVRKQHLYRIPDAKDMEEQRFAINCFATLILQVKELFEIDNDFVERLELRKNECKEQILDLSIILNRNDDSYRVYVNKCVDEIMRESKEKARLWISRLFDAGIEVQTKTANDACGDVVDGENDDTVPLKLFKCTLEMDAVKLKILQRVLSEHYWNKSVDEFEKIINLDDDTDLVRYKMNSVIPCLSREVLEFRSWKKDIHKLKYAFVQTSISNLNFLKSNRYNQVKQSNKIRADYYHNHYLIEYYSNKMKITHFNRVDLKGKSLAWYRNTYSYMLLENMKQLKTYLKHNMDNVQLEQIETIV